MAEKLHIRIPEIKWQGGGGEGKLEQMRHLAGFCFKNKVLVGSWVTFTGFQPTS